ncbi:MAG: tetratricopeptide repeat protein [Beijerinckiaceae bacterium]
MPLPERDPVAEFKRLLEALPEGSRGGGVQLLLQQMEPQKARLLRLCAIPHQFDTVILQTMMPELEAAEARQRCAEFSRLSIVITGANQLALHDEARDYLFHGWLQPQSIDAFAQVNAALVEWFTRQSADAVGDRLEELQDQRMFHLLGCDQAAGFAEFDRLLVQARHAFRLSRCATLLRLANEYRTVLDPERTLWLDYHAGKLEADRRELDAARALFERMLSYPHTPAELRVKVTNRLGQVAAARRAWPEAIARYREALALASDPNLDFPTHGILHDLGAAHRDSNELAKAERVFQQAIEAATRENTPSGLAACHNALGTLHLKRGDFQPAIKDFRLSLEYLEHDGERFRTAQALNNLGMAYVRHGDLEQGEQQLRRSLEIKREAGDSLGQASTLNNLVEVYRRQSRTNDALEANLQAIALFETMRASRQAGITYLNLGQLYRDINKSDLALQAYGEARSRFEASGAEDEIETADRAINSLASKRGLPWYAWTIMIVGVLVLFLGVIGLLIEAGKEEPSHLAVSADSRRWALSSEHEKRWTVNVDGKMLGPYDEILAGTPVFSLDSRRLALAAREGQDWFVVLDGTPLERHGAIVGLAFSPDGERFAYAADDAEKYRLIADAKSGPDVDEIFPGTIVFSPDSRRLSYRARIGEKRTLVLDHKPGPLFDRISKAPSVFSPDSRRLAYSGVRDGTLLMVVDGKESRGYDDIGFHVFSPDSQRVAYGAQRDGKWFIVIDDQEGPAYDYAGFPVFSPNSRRVAYTAKRGERVFLVVDGEEQEAFADLMVGTPVFSPDSQRMVYAAERNKKWVIVEKDNKSREWDHASVPEISPDGARLAYAASSRGKWRIVVDGADGIPYADLKLGPTLFAPAGRYVAYAASDDADWFVVVNEQPRKRFAEVWPPVFDGLNRIRYLAKTQGEGIHVVEEVIDQLREQPASGR